MGCVAPDAGSVVVSAVAIADDHQNGQKRTATVGSAKAATDPKITRRPGCGSRSKHSGKRKLYGVELFAIDKDIGGEPLRCFHGRHCRSPRVRHPLRISAARCAARSARPEGTSAGSVFRQGNQSVIHSDGWGTMEAWPISLGKRSRPLSSAINAPIRSRSTSSGRLMRSATDGCTARCPAVMDAGTICLALLRSLIRTPDPCCPVGRPQPAPASGQR